MTEPAERLDADGQYLASLVQCRTTIWDAALG